MTQIVKLPEIGQSQRRPVEFIATRTASEILDNLSICQQQGWMGAVTGVPGIGKTTTFRHFASKQPIDWRERHRADISWTVPSHLRREEAPYRPGVHFVTLTNMMHSAAALLKELTHDLNLPEKANAGYRYDVLCEKLRLGDLIIVDEAQVMNDGALDVLRSIHDKALIGIFVGANPKIMAKPGSSREADMAQFFSRFAITMPVDKTHDDDLTAFFDHHKVQGARARSLLRMQGGRPNLGPLRRISYFVEICHKLAGDGRPIEIGHVEKAIAALSSDR